MATKRTYGDRCGIARALDLVGERWALLVVRELLLGPKRFTDLRTGLPHLSPDVLAQRLRELESTGIVRRRKLAPPAASQVYELTEWGLELEPVLLALGGWGSRAPFPPGDAQLGVDGVRGTYELRLGEHTFSARVADGRLEVARESADRPDATIETEPGTLAAVLWHGRAARGLAIEGDRAAVTRFLTLFPAPEPAAGSDPG
jgi:DNA-binding HxlR family transcriptional regulator